MPERPRFIDFIRASRVQPQEFQLLKESVSQAKGTLGIWVHPYFHEFRNESIDGVNSERDTVFPDKDKAKKYEELRDRLISGTLQKGRPIVIFEGHNNLGRLRNKLTEDNGAVFVVETERNGPSPMGIGNDWIGVKDCLEELGVKRINLSGEYFSLIPHNELKLVLYSRAIERPIPVGRAFKTMSSWLSEVEKDITGPNVLTWAKQKMIPIGCVGQAALELISMGINTRVTPVTCPLPGVVLEERVFEKI